MPDGASGIRPSDAVWTAESTAVDEAHSGIARALCRISTGPAWSLLDLAGDHARGRGVPVDSG